MALRSLLALVDAWTPRLATAFIASMLGIRERVQVGVVAQRLEAGNLAAAVEAVSLEHAALRDFDRAFGEAYEDGGAATVPSLPPARDPDGGVVQVLFNVRNPRAETWLRDHSAGLVREVLDDQRAAIRNHLAAGMAEGRNPRAVALDLVGRIDPKTKRREGGVIGLTASQEEWARNYAAELAANSPAALTRSLRDPRFDRRVQKAIAAGEPLPADLREAMVAAYRNRALRYRAETIAHSESMTALHAGQEEATRQAVEAGQLDAAAVRKRWRSTRDSKVRDTHRHLDGQSVPLNGVFVSSSGARLRYPGDERAPAAERVGCRCYVEMRVT